MKVPKPKKKQRISDQVLDDLQRRYIRLISGGYCKRCGKEVGIEFIEVAHMFKRRRKTVRWDYRNVYPLCKNDPRTGKVGCHQIVDENPFELTSFMYQVLFTSEIKDLQRIANLTLKDYPIDREAIKKELKERIRKLE